MMYKAPVNVGAWTQNQPNDDLHKPSQLGFIYHRRCESDGVRVAFVNPMCY
jgi:hypothetical protein